MKEIYKILGTCSIQEQAKIKEVLEVLLEYGRIEGMLLGTSNWLIEKTIEKIETNKN